MVNYRFSCDGWNKPKRWIFAFQLCKELKLDFGFNQHIEHGNLDSPYIEVDNGEESVRIRKMTNLTEEEQENMIKKASVWYDVFGRASDKDIESVTDIGLNEEQIKIVMNNLMDIGIVVYVAWNCEKCKKTAYCNDANKFFTQGYTHEDCGHHSYPDKYGILMRLTKFPEGSIRCVICGRDFVGEGNNALPIAEGLCCDDCNKIVISARLKGNVIPNIQKIVSESNDDNIDDEVIYKSLGITENDRLKNFQLFKRYWTAKMNSKLDEEDFIGNLNMTLGRAVWKTSFKESLEIAKLFSLDEDNVPLILNTDCQDGHLPFPSFFIDTKVQIKNRTYFGFHVGSYYTEKTSYRAIMTVYTKLVKYKDKMEKIVVPDIILLAQDNGNEDLHFAKNDYYHDRIKNFIFTFCSFVNEPDVSVHLVEVNPKNNERRIARGIMPLPEYRKIVVHGKLRIYIDKINERISNGTRKPIGYQYWVRGFYRHFFNQKRYAKLYSLDEESRAKAGLTFSDKHKGVLRRWIKPTKRGQGILIKQSWEVKE